MKVKIIKENLNTKEREPYEVIVNDINELEEVLSLFCDNLKNRDKTISPEMEGYVYCDDHVIYFYCVHCGEKQ
jgi:hypothetical protein